MPFLNKEIHSIKVVHMLGSKEFGMILAFNPIPSENFGPMTQQID